MKQVQLRETPPEREWFTHTDAESTRLYNLPPVHADGTEVLIDARDNTLPLGAPERYVTMVLRTQSPRRYVDRWFSVYVEVKQLLGFVRDFRSHPGLMLTPAEAREIANTLTEAALAAEAGAA